MARYKMTQRMNKAAGRALATVSAGKSRRKVNQPGHPPRTIIMSRTTADPQSPQAVPLRDGLESLAEPVELSLPQAPQRHVAGSDADIDEALIETFPASDPPSSGRFD